MDFSEEIQEEIEEASLWVGLVTGHVLWCMQKDICIIVFATMYIDSFTLDQYHYLTTIASVYSLVTMKFAN